MVAGPNPAEGSTIALDSLKELVLSFFGVAEFCGAVTVFCSA
jgi:hypothetical protein